MSRPEVIAVFGPTAVGKTAVTLALADELRAVGEQPVAVSADALQVYQGLEILTGAATLEEQNRLEHRLISFLPLDTQFSVGQYAQLAHDEIDTLLEQGKRPIVVGGTGLYLRAAVAELSLRPPPAAEVRARWVAELAAHGPEQLHRTLAARAPWAAAQIPATDSQRIVRALELHESGELHPFPERSELWTQETRHPTLLVGLVMDRERLYSQIGVRVDAMVAAGAQDEVQRASAGRASATAEKALGFRELLDGDIDAMKQRTRNYARRQLTWMRKLPGVQLLDVTDCDPRDAAREILSHWRAL